MSSPSSHAKICSIVTSISLVRVIPVSGDLRVIFILFGWFVGLLVELK
jgi:hypothetical protein